MHQDCGMKILQFEISLLLECLSVLHHEFVLGKETDSIEVGHGDHFGIALLTRGPSQEESHEPVPISLLLSTNAEVMQLQQVVHIFTSLLGDCNTCEILCFPLDQQDLVKRGVLQNGLPEVCVCVIGIGARSQRQESCVKIVL